MKVFTNTNYATGKAGGDIKANRIVGLDTTSGDVVQAVASTVPIGVAHNFDADKGYPVTVLPLGAGFARVTAGEALAASDLGAKVGADAEGRVVKNATYALGVLAGLSADVEGATSAATGDDVVVLLNGGYAYDGPAIPSTGKVKFTALKGTTPEENVVVVITIGDQALSGLTDAEGEVEFELHVATYPWGASKNGKTVTDATGTVTIVAGETKAVALAIS